MGKQAKVNLQMRVAFVGLIVLVLVSAVAWIIHPLWFTTKPHLAIASPVFYQYEGDGAGLWSGPALEGCATSVPILFYHGIVEESDDFNTTIDSFVNQMEALKANGYQTINLEDFSNFQQGTFQLPAKPVILTFDDGRKDSYYNTDDVLQDLGFEATMFAIAGIIDRSSPFHLSWEELKEMAKSSRWDIECHGYDSHDMIGDRGYFLVTKYEGETDDEFAARIEKDYSTSIERMSEMLGFRPTAYAVPYGDYGVASSACPDPEAYAINDQIAEANFTFVLREGASSALRLNTATCDLHALSRLEVKNMSGEELIAALETELPSATDGDDKEGEQTANQSADPGPGETPVENSHYTDDVLSFAGYHWRGLSGFGSPGPNNNWESSNAWVDQEGLLHLKLSKQGDKWYCAQVQTTESLGFGEYEFQIAGRVDQLDPNVVLGVFSCPTWDTRPEGTDEVDIELSRWGSADYYNASYGVWGTQPGLGQVLQEFNFDLNSSYSTHRYYWDGRQVVFQSLYGNTKNDAGRFAYWRYAPAAYSERVAQQPMPVLMNLWLFQGHAPTNGQEVEIVISGFTFTPGGTPPAVVPNTAPVVEAGAGANINEGGTFSGSGSFTDLDTNYWDGTVDYGDGSGAQTLSLNARNKTFALNHIYANNGTYTVTVTVSDRNGGVGRDTATVTVNNVPPTVSSFSPTNGAVGTSVNIVGTNFTGATPVTFNGTSASFTVASSTSINATVPAGATSGPIRVTAPGGTATSSSSFTVSVGALATVIVSPNPATVTVGKTQTFTAQGYDASNNLISGLTFSWSTDVGSIDSSGHFTALATAATGYVRATSGAVHGDASVTVTVGVLDHISVTPATATVAAGATQDFSATGYDAANNPIPGLTFTWSTDVGSIDSSGHFTAQASPATGYVRATSGAVHGDASVTVTVGVLDHISVTPATATVAAGATQDFSATGYDAADNPIPGLTFTWSTDVGSIDSSGHFAAQASPATGYVRATSGSVSGDASVTVNAA